MQTQRRDMKYSLFLFALLLYGCCSPKETIRTVIETDTITVTLPADIVYDTVAIDNGAGESVRYVVKVDTVYKKVYIKGKEKIIQVPIIDTVRIVEQVPVEKSFFDGITLKQILIGCSILLVGVILFRLLKVIGAVG